MYKDIVDKYVKDVLSGKRVSCKFVKLAVERYVRDLERDDIYFDEDAANRFLEFSSYCKHLKGDLANKNVELSPYQIFECWNIFGFKRPNGKRRFTRVYNEVARKNGKSAVGAIISIYLTGYDSEDGAEVYCAATTKEQARVVHDVAMGMCRKLKTDSSKQAEKIGLSGGLRTSGTIYFKESLSKCEPLASNSDKLDGLNPHGAIVDEYHAHKDTSLIEVITSGMGSRSQPLTYIITTAGFEKQYPCYSEERKIAVNVLEGTKEDDSYFAIIYTLDDDDDWKDESVWIKANPNLGITPTWEFMRREFTEAINKGADKEVKFKTKNLNKWTNAAAVWINDEDWMLCGDELPDLKGRECYGGLDLAAKLDMNAYVLVFPPREKGEKTYVMPFFWLPENTIERKRELGNYLQWERDGLLRKCGIDIIDIDMMVQDILEINKDYNVKNFGFDTHRAYDGVIQGLEKEWMSGVSIRQAMVGLDSGTKELEALVRSKNLAHGGNDILRWQCGNVEIRFMNDMIHMEKSHNDRKIDGMVALAMALTCWAALRNEEEIVNIYSSRGIREI